MPAPTWVLDDIDSLHKWKRPLQKQEPFRGLEKREVEKRYQRKRLTASAFLCMATS